MTTTSSPTSRLPRITLRGFWIKLQVAQPLEIASPLLTIFTRLLPYPSLVTCSNTLSLRATVVLPWVSAWVSRRRTGTVPLVAGAERLPPLLPALAAMSRTMVLAALKEEKPVLAPHLVTAARSMAGAVRPQTTVARAAMQLSAPAPQLHRLPHLRQFRPMVLAALREEKLVPALHLGTAVHNMVGVVRPQATVAQAATAHSEPALKVLTFFDSFSISTYPNLSTMCRSLLKALSIIS